MVCNWHGTPKSFLRWRTSSNSFFLSFLITQLPLSSFSYEFVPHAIWHMPIAGQSNFKTKMEKWLEQNRTALRIQTRQRSHESLVFLFGVQQHQLLPKR
jgi:hypothetical protein